MPKMTPKVTSDGSSGTSQQLALPGDYLAMTPDFMREGDGGGSMDLLKQYVVPPRVKVIQGQAKKPFNELFRPGNLCAVPMMTGVWTEDFDPRAENVAFHFIPILFYPEWVSWNPYGSDLPAVRARSLDPRSDIAIKSRDPARRKEPCVERPTTPDGKPAFVSHLEHLNYVVMILPPNEMAELPIIMTFASGEHRSGTNFNTLLQQRRVKHLYGCQFAARVGRRENRHGTWFGIDVVNPAADSGVAPFVQDEGRFSQLRRVFEEYKSYYDERRLATDYDDDVVEGSAAPAAAEQRV